MLRDLGVSLTQCGSKWGEGVDSSDTSIIKAFVGKKSWIEVAVDGVIGLHGNEPGAGPGIVIHDILKTGIEMIWTSGLVGCMCLGIQGMDQGGKLDVFFCHARKYDKKNAVLDNDNPMKLAKDFIATHHDIHIFWGTDFNFGFQDRDGPMRRAEAQKLLSKELGYWVRNMDCIVSSELVFFPKLGIMKSGDPASAYQWARSNDLTAKSEFSNSKVLSVFEPDADILRQLEEHVARLQNDRSGWIRLYHLDSRRDNKIIVLSQIVDAYKVGNFDVLRYFSRYANNKTSPFLDESASNTWDALNESVTANLVLNAYNDAKTKIGSMGLNGCGLRPDGSDIHDENEYANIAHSAASSSYKAN